ncbi:MAG: cupredoxin domain-containing protein [Rhizobiales bacterium]|nr:cupredoxin domain-containing protein [Hyphomicrobiales bacterium]
MTRALLLAATLAGLGLAMTTATPSARAAEARITIDNFAFAPKTLTVKAGTTVIFDNADDSPHTVVAGNGAFRSPALDTGGKFTFTFATSGTFAYYCSLHPHMQGMIVVEP